MHVLEDHMSPSTKEIRKEFIAIKDKYLGVDKRTLNNKDLAEAIVVARVSVDHMSMVHLPSERDHLFEIFEGRQKWHQNYAETTAEQLRKDCFWTKDEVVDVLKRAGFTVGLRVTKSFFDDLAQWTWVFYWPSYSTSSSPDVDGNGIDGEDTRNYYMLWNAKASEYPLPSSIPTDSTFDTLTLDDGAVGRARCDECDLVTTATSWWWFTPDKNIVTFMICDGCSKKPPIQAYRDLYDSKTCTKKRKNGAH